MHRKLLLIIYILTGLLLLPAIAQAQTTFTVTVQSKSNSHPNFGQGHPEAYVIDGTEATTLTLMRGVTYTFQLDGVSPIHPLYISTSNVGGGGGAFDDGVTNNFATGDEQLIFTPDENTPDDLFYQCGIHAFMGFNIQVVGTTTAIGELGLPNQFALRGNAPNPFQTVTTLRFDLPNDADVRVQVFNVLGQEVLLLPRRRMPAGAARPIVVDAADLTPGLYIYRVTMRAGGQQQVKSGRMVLLR